MSPDSESPSQEQSQEPSVDDVWYAGFGNGPSTLTAAASKATAAGVKISVSGLVQRLNGKPRCEVGDLAGRHRTDGVMMKDVITVLEDLAEIRIHLDESGIYVDKDGKSWATLQAMQSRFQLPKNTILRHASGAATLEARNHRGKPILVYDLSAVQQSTSSLLEARANSETPAVDKNGFWQDEQGVTWGTIDAIHAALPEDKQRLISEAALLRNAQKHCISLAALDRLRRPGAQIFPVEEIYMLPVLSSNIRVDENGFYTDDDETRWASGKTWAKHYRISMRAINNAITKSFGTWEDLPHIKGFGKAKREDRLYPEDKILNAIAYIVDGDNTAIDEIVTVLRDNGDSVEEVVYATTRGFVQIIPEDVIPRYKYRRLFEEQRVDSVDRRSSLEDGAFEVQAVVDAFRAQIQGVLAEIEDAPEDGNLVQIGQFINENPQVDRVKLKRNLDLAERHTRKTADGNIVFLYSRTQLDEIAKAA